MQKVWSPSYHNPPYPFCIPPILALLHKRLEIQRSLLIVVFHQVELFVEEFEDQML